VDQPPAEQGLNWEFCRHLQRSDRSITASIDLSSTALLLDVDGTIVDFAPVPDGVAVPGPLLASLARLHKRTGGALALVSGRMIDDLDRLFSPLELPAIGGHGAQIRPSSRGAIQRNYQDRAIDSECLQPVAALSLMDEGVIVENKATSLAIHYRQAPHLENLLKSVTTAIADRCKDLEILYGKAVIEMKPAHFTKGTAVHALMQQPPFRGRRPFFVGDDATDQSVFSMLTAYGGIGYSVERLMPGAAGMFGSPHEVRSWLAALCRQTPVAGR
jgi:trehalose 6-phosphate phosphatase